MTASDSIWSKFQSTLEFVNNKHKLDNLPLSPSVSISLYLYGRARQATVGDCNIDAPSYFYVQERMKWNSWDTLRGMKQWKAVEEFLIQLREYILSIDITLLNEQGQQDAQFLLECCNLSQPELHFLHTGIDSNLVSNNEQQAHNTNEKSPSDQCASASESKQSLPTELRGPVQVVISNSDESSTHSTLPSFNTASIPPDQDQQSHSVPLHINTENDPDENEENAIFDQLSSSYGNITPELSPIQHTTTSIPIITPETPSAKNVPLETASSDTIPVSHSPSHPFTPSTPQNNDTKSHGFASPSGSSVVRRSRRSNRSGHRPYPFHQTPITDHRFSPAPPPFSPQIDSSSSRSPISSQHGLLPAHHPAPTPELHDSTENTISADVQIVSLASALADQQSHPQAQTTPSLPALPAPIIQTHTVTTSSQSTTLSSVETSPATDLNTTVSPPGQTCASISPSPPLQTIPPPSLAIPSSFDDPIITLPNDTKSIFLTLEKHAKQHNNTQMQLLLHFLDLRELFTYTQLQRVHSKYNTLFQHVETQFQQIQTHLDSIFLQQHHHSEGGIDTSLNESLAQHSLSSQHSSVSSPTLPLSTQSSQCITHSLNNIPQMPISSVTMTASTTPPPSPPVSQSLALLQQYSNDVIEPVLIELVSQQRDIVRHIIDDCTQYSIALPSTTKYLESQSSSTPLPPLSTHPMFQSIAGLPLQQQPLSSSSSPQFTSSLTKSQDLEKWLLSHTPPPFDSILRTLFSIIRTSGRTVYLIWKVLRILIKHLLFSVGSVMAVAFLANAFQSYRHFATFHHFRYAHFSPFQRVAHILRDVIPMLIRHSPFVPLPLTMIQKK